jgi:molybdopterin converting factor subunit 1
VITVHVEYFAILREQRGAAREELATGAATPAELYEELRRRHRFSLAGDRVRIAINDEFAEPGAVLRSGDRVVFIPPVAGG